MVRIPNPEVRLKKDKLKTEMKWTLGADSLQAPGLNFWGFRV
jgi:hypothetical protein